MYGLLNQVGNLTVSFESIKNFSYDLVANQSPTTSLVLITTMFATLPILNWAESRLDSFSKAAYFTAFTTAAVSYFLFGTANYIRIYRLTYEPFAKVSEAVSAFLSRNFSPEISNQVSEYALGTTVALALPIIAYGVANKKKWAIVPALGLTMLLNHKLHGYLLSK
ncbi:MAG: hypothetical protein JSS30_01780 [Verrucomicrobia bacterium]|nr:hypothetical protein [Verrucomicrobiota bacterium]